MNKDLLDKLTQSSEKLLDFIEKTGETSVDFAKEQVPLVIQEVLSWGFYSNGLYLIINLILFLIFLSCNLYSIKIGKRLHNDTDGIVWLGCCFGLTPTLITFVNSIAYGSTVLKIWCAPRLYLLETLRTLIK